MPGFPNFNLPYIIMEKTEGTKKASAGLLNEVANVTEVVMANKIA